MVAGSFFMGFLDSCVFWGGEFQKGERNDNTNFAGMGLTATFAFSTELLLSWRQQWSVKKQDERRGFGGEKR